MVNSNNQIPDYQLDIISRSLVALKGYFDKNIYNLISGEISYLYQLKGNEVLDFLHRLRDAIDRFVESRNNNKNITTYENIIPYLKRAVLLYRKQEAHFIDEQKAKSSNPDLSKKLDNYLLPIDEILQSTWMKNVEPVQLPRISDFLSVEIIDKFLNETNKISEREYDEKFHILQSPKLFFKDLEHFRNVCEIRGCFVAVAYLDIDNFKNLNTKYGEVEIDRKVLPRFMQALESFVYNHGFAYRYGGDEYVLILVNVSKASACQWLDSLRLKIKELTYQDIEERTTISIGYCLVEPDCYLTNRDIEKKANDAKNFAKNNGKDCIATYKNKEFELENLCLSTDINVI
jgi:diguanylate cyclase (GGDEF)-like protein